MSNRRFLADVSDLCDEQKFRWDTTRDNALRVWPRNGTDRPVLIYSHGKDSDLPNARAALRRIGLKFPGDEKPSSGLKGPVVCRHKPGPAFPIPSRSESTVVTAVKPEIKVIGTAQPVNSFDLAREKISIAVNALGDLEEALNKLEAETKPLQALKDVLRGISL